MRSGVVLYICAIILQTLQAMQNSSAKPLSKPNLLFKFRNPNSKLLICFTQSEYTSGI